METWSSGIDRTPQAIRPAARQPSVKPRKNGIAFTLPAASQAQVEIFNAKGVLIRRVSTDGRASLTVPVSAKGLYVYRIRSGSDVFRGSVVVR
jgi:hypothetical protein